MKDKKVCLTEKEVLENPNDNKLGELVRKKFWSLLTNTFTLTQTLPNQFMNISMSSSATRKSPRIQG